MCEQFLVSCKRLARCKYEDNLSFRLNWFLSTREGGRGGGLLCRFLFCGMHVSFINVNFPSHVLLHLTGSDLCKVCFQKLGA